MKLGPGNLPEQQLGDGVTIATSWNEAQFEAAFLIHGEEIAVAYVDEDGLPRVDFHERNHIGIDAFKRTLIVFSLAWTHAELLAVAWRRSRVAEAAHA